MSTGWIPRNALVSSDVAQLHGTQQTRSCSKTALSGKNEHCHDRFGGASRIEIAVRTIDSCLQLETTSGRSSVVEQTLPKLRFNRRPCIGSSREKHPCIYVYMPISGAFCRIWDGIGRDSVGF